MISDEIKVGFFYCNDRKIKFQVNVGRLKCNNHGKNNNSLTTDYTPQRR
jgi:hypothetical protein